jgi:hypothetical protein
MEPDKEMTEILNKDFLTLTAENSPVVISTGTEKER